VKTDHELSGDHGDQLSLSPDAPLAGERYVNRHTGQYATIVSVRQRKHQWVLLRTSDAEREILTSDLEDFWVRL
jgi:hypothetical protein